MKFLLCLKCRRAWIGSVAASCCAEQPLDCNPWSADGRAWYVARVSDRIGDIYSVLTSNQMEKRRSLLKGIRAKGNDSFRARAA